MLIACKLLVMVNVLVHAVFLELTKAIDTLDCELLWNLDSLIPHLTLVIPRLIPMIPVYQIRQYIRIT